MRLQQRLNLLSVAKHIGGAFDAQLSIATRAVLDMNNNVQFDPDNLPTSLSNLLASPGAAASLGATNKVVFYSVATTGFSHTVNANGQDEDILLNPAGTLATGTIVFPSDAQSRIGQKITIQSQQIQTALTLTTAGLTIIGTAVTALTAKQNVVFEKVAAATWLRTA